MSIRALTLANLVVLTALALPAAAEPIRVSVTVSGLTCPSCSVIAGRSIDALEGAEVLGFEAGKGGTGTFAVIYDDALLAPAATEAAIEANGYDAALAGSAS